MKLHLNCPICNESMHKIADIYFLCRTCRYMSSNEQPGAGTEVIPLETIRRKNFKFICNIIKEKFPQAKTILDVGCSSGLFLEIARDEGFLVTGLEPAEHLVKETLSRGFDVINGFFPQTENLLNKKYDIIVFNDSFEHIPNLQEVLHGIKTYLTDKGCAIINIPTSEGLVFKIASILYKFRIKTPYHRMWQKGFPSPHLHYFNLQNLRKLFENNGFAMHYSSPIQYFTIQGLWKRISGKSLFIVSISTWLFMILLYPLLSIRSDTIMACFSLKKEST